MVYSAEELAEVHATVVRSVDTKDADLFASLYTEDGVLMLPDGSIIEGRAAIKEAFEAWLKAGFVRQEVQLIDLYSEGTIAVEEGRAAGTFQTNDGYKVNRSNYVIVHRLGPDGRWLMHHDIWTAVGEGSGAGY